MSQLSVAGGDTLDNQGHRVIAGSPAERSEVEAGREIRLGRKLKSQVSL